MHSYVAPKLTRIGSFKMLTKALGRKTLNDAAHRPALFVITW